MRRALLDQEAAEYVRRVRELEGEERPLRAEPTEAPTVPTANVVTLRDVVPERVSWLWPSRIAAGKLTLLVGDPEAGKSTLACDAAAHVSTGQPWPDGASCPRGDVLYLTLEDGLADTIRPRLDAAGADCARVHSITGIRGDGNVGRPLTLPDDLPSLEDVVRARGVLLLVLDPIKGYMSGAVNEWRDGDVRRVLGPLAQLAERNGVAVLAILHLTKASGTPAQYRVSGSIAFTGAARSVLLAAPDPEAPDNGRRVFAPLKCSLCRRPDTLTYVLSGSDGTDDGPARVEWGGVSAVTAYQALSAQGDDGDERSRLDEAMEWLADVLADGPREVSKVLQQARADGISQRTLERARARLRVKSIPSGFGGRRLITLPASPVSATSTGIRHTSGMAETGRVGGDWSAESPEEAERRALQSGA